jgi:hypothetical protein
LNNKKWLGAARDFTIITSEITSTTGAGLLIGYILSKALGLDLWIYGITLPIGLFLGVYRIAKWSERKK